MCLLSTMGSSGQPGGLGATWQQHRGHDGLAEHFPMYGAATCLVALGAAAAVLHDQRPLFTSGTLVASAPKPFSIAAVLKCLRCLGQHQVQQLPSQRLS